VIIKNVSLRLTYPRGFTPKEISPAATRGNNIWDFESLAPNKEGEITIAGKITGVSGELKELKSQIGIVEGGLFKLQNQVSHIASVIEPQMQISIETDPQDVKFGDNVVWKVKYKNSNDLALQNVRLEVRIQDIENLIKRESIEFAALKGSVSKDKNSITVSFDNLDKLEPQEEASEVFLLDIVKAPIDIEADNTLEAQAVLSADSTDVTVPLKFQSEQLKRRIL
jgi:hypothetical protein